MDSPGPGLSIGWTYRPLVTVFPEFSQLTWLSRLGSAVSSYGICCKLSLLCPQRKMAGVLVRSGVLSSLAGAVVGGGGGHYLCILQGSSKKIARNY